MWELRYHLRIIGLLHIIGLCPHACVTRSSALCSTLVCAALGSWSCLGHPQPPDRSQHGCTVGVNRDPPVWPSTQAGWWRNQSASPTYVGRVLRFEGDVDNRRVQLHVEKRKKSGWKKRKRGFNEKKKK